MLLQQEDDETPENVEYLYLWKSILPFGLQIISDLMTKV